MSYAEQINTLKRLQEGVKTSFMDRYSLAFVKEVQSLMIVRIFQKGLNSTNGSIGAYSTEEIRMSRSQFPQKSKFKPAKKGGKSMLFEGGYSEFRTLNGRTVSVVNLNLFGDLQTSLQAGMSGGGFVVGIVGAENAKKSTGNEKHFKSSIFTPTADEIEQGKKAAQIQLMADIKNLINA